VREAAIQTGVARLEHGYASSFYRIWEYRGTGCLRR
jgi:hypothetical protein